MVFRECMRSDIVPTSNRGLPHTLALACATDGCAVFSRITVKVQVVVIMQVELSLLFFSQWLIECSASVRASRQRIETKRKNSKSCLLQESFGVQVVRQKSILRFRLILQFLPKMRRCCFISASCHFRITGANPNLRHSRTRSWGSTPKLRIATAVEMKGKGRSAFCSHRVLRDANAGEVRRIRFVFRQGRGLVHRAGGDGY